MRKRELSARIPGVRPIRTGRRKLVESCSDLRQLVFWMENDRSLGAQPDKIIFLKDLLVNVEDQIRKMPRIMMRGASNQNHRN